jgi:hypothetical protein
MEITLSCHSIVKGYTEGEAIVSKDPICFYLVEPKSGVVIEKKHSLEGKSIAKKILVFPTGKGSSVVQVDGLHQLAMNRNLPKALIIQKIETVLVCAAILEKVILVDDLQKNPLKVISTGDYVKVDADREIVTIHKKLEKRMQFCFSG